MTYFYLSAAGIVLVAILFAYFPLFVEKLSKVPGKLNAEVSNANVIKQRIGELEREVNEGLIDASEKENAIRDLKLALVDETPTQKLSAQTTNSLIMIAIAIPAVLIGAWVYWQSNQLDGLQTFAASTSEVVDLRKKLEEQGPQSLTPDDFAKFALSLRNSLHDNPDDAKAWSLLAMVNTSIGRVKEGIAAYEKALDLTPQDQALRYKYAEALMLQGTEESLRSAGRQLTYLIQKEPENPNHRLLMTTLAIQLQDAELALAHFTIIKDLMNSDSQFYQSIVSELRKLGVTDVAIVGETPVNESVVAQSKLESSLVAETNESTALSTEIVINVNISDELKSKLPENAYIIVFAQHSDGRSRAPLAVKRFKLPSLPIQLSLSDKEAMIPTMNLSSASFVNVTARISMDEDVMPSAGELEGSVTNIELAKVSGVIDVVINKVL